VSGRGRTRPGVRGRAPLGASASTVSGRGGVVGKRAGSGGGRQGDGVAEGLELTDEVVGTALCIDALRVEVGSEVGQF